MKSRFASHPFWRKGICAAIGSSLAFAFSGCKIEANNRHSVSLLSDSNPPAATLQVPIIVRGGHSLTLSYSVSDGETSVESAELQFSADGVTFTDVQALDPGSTSVTWNVPALDVSGARLRIVAVDEASNTATIDSPALTIDSTPPGAPSASLSTSALTNQSLAGITISSCGDAAQILVNEASMPGSADVGWQECSTAAGAILYSASGDGAHSLKVWAKDAAGNVSLSSGAVSFTLDETAPAVTLTSLTGGQALQGGSTQSITWTATDTHLSASPITLEYSSDSGSTWNAIAGPLSNSGTYSWSVPSSDGSNFRVRVSASDQAGNVGRAVSSADLIIDSTPPSVSITTPSGPLKGGSSVSVSFNASDSSGTIASIGIQYAPDGTTFGSSLPVSPTTATSYSWTVSTDDVSTAKLKITVTDAVGNTATATTSAFTIDSTAPGAPSVTLVGSNYRKTTGFALTAGDCTDKAFILVNEGSQPTAGDSGWQTCSTSAGAITYTIAATEGSHALQVWAKDAAGNISAAASTVTVYYDVTSPTLAITTPSTPVAGGGATYAVSFSVTDASTSSSQTFTLEASNDNGASWSTIGTQAASDGPLSAQAFTYNWTTPTWNVTQAKLRLSFTDLAGNSSQVTSAAFKMDSAAPTLTAAAMQVNGGATSTSNNYVQVSLQGTDNFTNITHFCLKYNDTTTPLLSDGCWIAVNASPPGLTPSTSLSLPSFYYTLGFSTGSYTVYAWLRDEAGNISTLTNAGAGTEGTDRATITYTPGAPPTVINVGAYSTDSPSSPPVSADLTVGNPGSVYVKWNATDDQTLPSNPISLYYTTDDANYTLIASGIANAQGSGCTIVPGTHTGCYVWTNNVTSGYLKVRVSVEDTSQMVSFASSTPMNVMPPISVIAGNTDPGLNGSASAAMFFNDLSDVLDGDTGSLVVSPGGKVYFRDIKRGVLTIDPADGVQRVLIPTTGTASGDGGPITSATLRNPWKIALDFQGRLLIFDYDRIRRVDTSANPMTIDTVIGGGASTSDGVAPTALLITAPGTIGNYRFSPFFALPNGDIYFQSDHDMGTTASGAKIRIYRASSNTIASITPSGLGDSISSTQDVTQCRLTAFGVAFDPITSAIGKMMFTSRRDPGLPNCVLVSTWGASAALDPATGTTISPPAVYGTEEHNLRVEGMDGSIYAVNRVNAKIGRYNPSNNTWTTLVGTGTKGTCSDGTVATSCNIDPQDVFVSAQSQVYFMDRGRLRMIDTSGKVLTLMGQSFYFGDGGSALSARFGVIDSIHLWNNGGADTLITLDEQELRFREFPISGSIQTIAGNGNIGTPNTTSPAAGQAIMVTTSQVLDYFAGDSSGNVYFARGTNFLSKLDRSTGMWADIAGGGTTSYKSADGMGGSTVQFSANYIPSVTGFDGTNVLTSLMSITSGLVSDAFMKLYSVSGGTQSHFAGVTGNSADTFSVDGTAAASCTVPNAMNMADSTYDSYGSRWVVAKRGTSGIRTMTVGGSIGTLKVLPRTIRSFAYRHDASNDILYYCATDGKLYKYDLNASLETAYAWPVSTITCDGYSLIYSASRGSLVFPFRQNGMSGIAEYIAP